MKPVPKKIFPPIYALALLLLSIGLGKYLPVLEIIPPSFAAVGIVVIAVGSLLNLWAFFLFWTHRTTLKPYGEPSALMKSGIFRVTRNPIYLGVVLILFGVSIRAGSLSAFVSPAIFFLLCEPLAKLKQEGYFLFCGGPLPT